jgi:phosphosulfolactate synthase
MTIDARERGSQWLDLPVRPAKPRTNGLTMVIDNGVPTRYFEDAVASASEHIDIVKFGWGTCLVTADLDRKVDAVRSHGIKFCFGGTLFEKFVVQDRFDAFVEWCRQWRCDLVEVSNGTIPLSNADKASYIRRCADEFRVTSEVGFKDAARSDRLSAAQWIDCIGEDFDAGANYVITEARESGKAGTCRPDGRLRDGLIEAILAAGYDPDRLIFEAPTKDLQAAFVTMLGPNANIGNVALGDVIGVETLRLGLRSDTLMHFEAASIYA